MNLFKIAPIFISVVFCIIIAWLVFVGFVVYKGATEINENGVSGVVHNVWCGKKTECKVPGVEQ